MKIILINKTSQRITEITKIASEVKQEVILITGDRFEMIKTAKKLSSEIRIPIKETTNHLDIVTIKNLDDESIILFRRYIKENPGMLIVIGNGMAITAIRQCIYLEIFDDPGHEIGPFYSGNSLLIDTESKSELWL